MSDSFIGEIKMCAFKWAPKGWLLCDGAELPVKQYAALYALLSNQFGGDRNTKFNLPDLRGRTPIGIGQLKVGGPHYNQGDTGGAETVPLTEAMVPPHMHTVNAFQAPGTSTFPADGYLATAVRSIPTTSQAFNIYLPNSGIPDAQSLAKDTVSPAGGDVPHENMQPFTVVNFCISTIGYYPPRP